jgi:hypothetical protein
MKILDKFDIGIKPIVLIMIFLVLTALSLRADTFTNDVSLFDVECKGHTLYNIYNGEPYYYNNTQYPVYCYYDGTVLVIQNLDTTLIQMEY